jgi:hypothetical protein
LPGSECLPFEDPANLARKGQPSPLVLSVIEEASAPGPLDEAGSLLTRPVFCQHAGDAAALVYLQLDLAARLTVPGAYAQDPPVNDGPGKQWIAENCVGRQASSAK